MRVAGYTGADNYLKRKAEDLLKDPTVQEALRKRDNFRTSTNKIIADRQERQALWTAIMRNTDPHYKEELDENGIPKAQGNIPLQTRLKASELLGKSEADFIEKIDINANVTITDLIQQSYLTSDDDIDAIEAEYHAIKDKRALVDSIPLKEEKPIDIDDFV
jgi:hypothetical protein